MTKTIFIKSFTALVLITSVIVIFNACSKTDDVVSDSRDEFVGSWKVRDYSGKDTLNYQITISKYGSNSVKIWNFGLLTDTVVALVSGSTFSISKQVFSNATITSGSGTYNTNKTLSYSYIYDGKTYTGNSIK